jgi:negative regulator of sigma E activity
MKKDYFKIEFKNQGLQRSKKFVSAPSLALTNYANVPEDYDFVTLIQL